MKHLTFAAALLAATAVAPTAFAQDSELSFSAGADVVTQYVFRGVSLADDAVQPYLEASYGNFTLGGWASLGIAENSDAGADEFDLYVGYSVPLDSSISVDLGATYFHFPEFGSFFETEGGAVGTYEVSASVGFGEVPLSPSVTGYYDFTLEAFTLEGSVGHSIPFGGQSLDLGLTGGLVDADGGGDYQWATASAAVSHSFNDDVSGYLGANFTLNSDDNLDFDRALNGSGPTDNLFWFGAGLSTGF